MTIAALLHNNNIRVRRIPRGSEPGTFFEVVGHPSFILIARLNRSNERSSPVFKIQLALSDHYQTYAQFLADVEAVFSPEAFHPDNSLLQRIDYFVDLPIRTDEAVLGAIYEPARGYTYGKGTFSLPRQIVIGGNPCLTVYDRARRLQRLSSRASSRHRVANLPEGPLSRFEVRYKREVQNGVNVLPLELQEVFHPDQLIEHARLINSEVTSPFQHVQFYNTAALQLPEPPHVQGLNTDWNDEALQDQIRNYIRTIERTARIKGMMEVANLHLVRGYCRPFRGIRGFFGPIERALPTPFDLPELFRMSVVNYFELRRNRPRPVLE